MRTGHDHRVLGAIGFVVRAERSVSVHVGAQLVHQGLFRGGAWPVQSGFILLLRGVQADNYVRL